jgi:hypothetical protein
VTNYRKNPVNSEDEAAAQAAAEKAKAEKEKALKAAAAEEAKAAVKEESEEEATEAKAAAEEYGKEGNEDEYYDEEDYGKEEDKEEDESDDEAAQTGGIDPKLAAKYSFLFKKRDEMTPAERRWKWVKKSALPKDLVELMETLTKDKKKKKESTVKEVTEETEKDQLEAGGADFVTLLSARNDLDVDYTNAFNVKERLEYLKKDRIKGKYSPEYHVRVMSLMIEKMPDRDEDVTLKVEVLLLMIGTLFQTAKQGSVLGRAEWMLTGKRILQLLVQIDKPVFKKALKKAHSEEGGKTKEKFDIEETNVFEVERSVFPSLSNFVEHLDEHLWKSF